MSPPIRPAGQGHQDALWRGLATGMLDTVGTDHCPFTMEQKRLGLGRLHPDPERRRRASRTGSPCSTPTACARDASTCNRMVALGSTNAARIFGLYPRKGEIAVGSDADLVLYDPAGTSVRSASTHHSRCDRNPYEGMAVQGRVTHVVVNGRVAFADGRLDVEPGAGRYLARAPRVTPGVAAHRARPRWAGSGSYGFARRFGSGVSRASATFQPPASRRQTCR